MRNNTGFMRAKINTNARSQYINLYKFTADFYAVVSVYTA